MEEMDRRIEALTADAVGEAVREAAASALWLVPPAVGVYDQRIRQLPSHSERAVDGRKHGRPPGVPEDMTRDVLVVGRDGVTVQEPDAPPITVLADECRALQAFADGARLLWAADSIRLFVHPAMWADGEEAIAAIDAMIDESLVVRPGESSGYDPPISEEAAASGGGGLLRRWRRR